MSRTDGILERAAEQGQDAAIRYGHNMIVVSQRTIAEMDANTRKMGEMILQLGTMIGTMQRRMDEMEARQAAVTISHREVLGLMARIRFRAQEIGKKYGLGDRESQKLFRGAIKRELLKRYGIRDLHDLPAAMLPAAEKQTDSWTDIRLVMERRNAG